ncbi:MAG: transporter substrate-binding domain-containing protein [Candidatus Omnitrophota bacterium]
MKKILSIFVFLAFVSAFTGFIIPKEILAEEKPQIEAPSARQTEIAAEKNAEEKARLAREQAHKPAETLLPEGHASKKTLVFAGHDEFAPYSYISDGRPAGYCVDLIKILSATINKDITIQLMPWEECLSKLRAGKVDGLIGAAAYKKRMNYADYSEPVSEVEFAIFVESSNSYVHSVKSLEGTVVAVHEASLIADELRKNERIRLLEVKSIPEALNKLKNREVTAVIAEKRVLLYYIQQEKLHDLKIVGAAVGPVYEYSLAIKKGKTELLKDINYGVTVLKENGTLKKLERKWLGIRLVEPFPWKMVSMVIGGITGILLLLMGLLWATSLEATVKAKTRQIQLMGQRMVEKDKLAVLGKLAGQIAHELRTPLSIINNSVFLLRKEGSENRELFEKRLRVLEDKIKLSSNILESILSYSRVKAEMATTVSVKEAIAEVLKDIGMPEGIENDVSFEKEELLQVFMDFHQLYSVFRNILLNSVQAMGKEGKLTIKAFPSADNTKVNVRMCDTGGGIMDGAQNKIFNLFYSTKITGTGLGLPISKSIIEANGGRLYLEETTKEGTCFIVELPSVKTLVK